MTHYLLPAALAALCLAPAQAQTPSEQLQKGIYAQETAGDLDAAIRIFRMVANGSPGERTIGGEAQSRLVQALLQKQDANGAALEFAALARNYPEFAERLFKTSHVEALAVSKGTVKNGRYRNTSTGVELALLPGWSLQGDGQSSDNGEMAMLHDGESGLEMGVWMIREASSPAEVAQKLANAIPEKAVMHPEGHFRGMTGEPKTIDGKPALSGTADAGKEIRYYTWIYTTKTRTVFIAYIDPEKYAAQKDRADRLVAAALVP